MPHIVFDTEVFGNRFLFCGRVLENRNLITIWDGDDCATSLLEVLNSGCTFISFNGNNYDLPIISAVVAGLPHEQLKSISNAIVKQDARPWMIRQRFNLPQIDIDHIDLIETAPGIMASLKTYGARMHMQRVEDLPLPHDAMLTDEQKKIVESYCVNDLETTEFLFERLRSAIDLRVKMGSEYGIDFRSKSDTQMAEAAFAKRLNLTRAPRTVPATVSYQIPAFIDFKTPSLQDLAKDIVACEYEVDQSSGHVLLPEFMEKRLIHVGKGTYRMGIGGLHSTHDKHVCHVASKEYFICDIDAASFYPSIILNCNLIPQNLGKAFLDEYSAVYAHRMTAKRSGDKVTADTLKISLNGTFGKTSSRFSPLYSPDLTMSITLTGQLVLLNLIEQFVEVGADILSANTDGIAVGGARSVMEAVQGVVEKYSAKSGFEFEYTPYRTLAMKDVNNYIAITTKKKVKAKGLYSAPGLMKNPTAYICSLAVSQWLLDGTPFQDTIANGRIEDFISVRGVTGGGEQGAKRLGKVVRWYASTDKTLPPITYIKNGNKVPKTDGVRECMNMPSAKPADLDLAWYRKECIEIAQDIGCKEFLTAEELAIVYVPPKVKKTTVKKTVETPRVLVWFSCGAASAVAAKMAIAKHPGAEILYCDTLAYEHPDNIRFLNDVGAWIGKEIKILKSDKYDDIFDVFDKTGWLIGVGGARCTTELKKNVRKAYERFGDTHVFGLTADEGARITRFEDQNSDTKVEWILADNNVVKKDCYRIIQEAGIELPMMYKLGYNNNNCIGCVKGQAGYWNKIRVDFPEAFDRMAKQERKMNAAINKSYAGDGKRKRVFLDELDPSAGRGVPLPDIECGALCMTPEQPEELISKYETLI